MNAIRPVVVGTAGHIDHGKSHLVRALTGIDPDRLKEERERGITIDLGFAHCALADGTRIGFVDVPGHERFVRNMLAGVGGIDLVLLVVAADESIKPQTREHFDICRLLRIPRGVVALTKADLVDDDILDLVRLEVREFLAGSFLESAPVVAVSSRTGRGLDDLREALGREARAVPDRAGPGLARLPIDRAFSIRGFGTVVTGTLIDGVLAEGQEVEILPRRLGARIRGLEVHKTPTARAVAGQRVAANLQGLETGVLARGDLLTEPGVLLPTHLLDVFLEYLPAAPTPLRDLARVGLHLMTAETSARVKIVGGGQVAPGACAYAQLRTESPVTALPGDRFILRRRSPPLTIGGGTVLHNAPPKLRGLDPGLAGRYERLASPDPATRLRVLVEEAGVAGIDAVGLRARTGFPAAATAAALEPSLRGGEVLALGSAPVRYLDGRAGRALSDAVLATLSDYHRREPLREGLPREEIRTRVFARSHPEVFRGLLTRLADGGRIRTERDRVALAGHQVSLQPAEAALLARLEDAFRAAGANPPDLPEASKAIGADLRRAEKLLHLLLTRGRLLRIPDGKIFHVEAVEALKRRLWDRRAASPEFDIAEFKDLSGTSRKNAIPLLEYFDQAGVTRRDGSRRLILPPPADRRPSD